MLHAKCYTEPLSKNRKIIYPPPLDAVGAEINKGMKQKYPSNLYLRNEWWWMHVQRGGKRNHFPLHTKELAEAVRKRDSYLADPKIIYCFRQHTLGVQIEKYVKDRIVSKRWSRESAAEKSRLLNVFCDAIGSDRSLYSIKTSEIETYLTSKLSGGCKGGTVNGYLTIIQAFFEDCVRDHLLINNPATEIDSFPDEHPVREIWCSEEEVSRLYRATPTDDLRFIVGCGFFLGLRRKEITEARPVWFNLEAKMATIKLVREDLAVRTGLDSFITKTRKERSIPIPDPFVRFLQIYLTDRDYCLAPSVRRGAYKYRYDFRRPFEDYVRSQNLSKVTPHVMRHTFATHLARQGKPITQLAGYLGDSVKTTLRHYAHHYPNSQDIAGIYGIQ